MADMLVKYHVTGAPLPTYADRGVDRVSVLIPAARDRPNLRIDIDEMGIVLWDDNDPSTPINRDLFDSYDWSNYQPAASLVTADERVAS